MPGSTLSRRDALRALQEIRNVGPALAERLYEDLGVRSVAELSDWRVAARLTSVRGLGERRASEIIEDARRLSATERVEWLALLRCPGCGHDGLDRSTASVVCATCRREYLIDHGVVDLAPPNVTTPSVTQRIMESRFYAKFYEDVMRPRLTGVVTDRTLDEEYELSTVWLELENARTILDVACGTGNFTRRFAWSLADAGNEDAILFGADISWPMLEEARRYLRRDGLTDAVQLIRVDAGRLALVSGGFDRIHCAGALHLMADIDGALREFARLLEPGGILVLGTFVLGRGLGRRLVKRLAEVPTKFHWFGSEELDRRLRRVGLIPVEQSREGDAVTIKAIRG